MPVYDTPMTKVSDVSVMYFCLLSVKCHFGKLTIGQGNFLFD